MGNTRLFYFFIIVESSVGLLLELGGHGSGGHGGPRAQAVEGGADQGPHCGGHRREEQRFLAAAATGGRTRGRRRKKKGGEREEADIWAPHVRVHITAQSACHISFWGMAWLIWT